MTGIDTNVLVRYIAQDDEVQAQAATAFIETRCASGEKIFINHTVLCELVWVLKKCYKLSKTRAVAVLERVVNTSQFTFENPQIIRQALNHYKDGSADFSDYVISRTNQHHHCGKTVTFDRLAGKSKGFAHPLTKANLTKCWNGPRSGSENNTPFLHPLKTDCALKREAAL